MNIAPNIFEFATSELSQDAFICWLVSYVNHPEEAVLHECSKDFISMLYNLKYGVDTIVKEDVLRLVDKPKRQYFDIDVYFQCVIKDKTCSFIIEDKMHTTQHSGQLSKYKKKIEEDGVKEDDVISIYFKTGYLLSRDYDAEKKYEYKILDYRTLNKFLQRYKTDNIIFESYKEYISTNFFEYYETSLNDFFKNDDIKLFEKDFVQWEFMSKLLDRCREYGNNLALIEYKISEGTSFGRPFTSIDFLKIPDLYAQGKEEFLFYRLDSRREKTTGSERYYLSLRQYANLKDYPSASEKKHKKLFRLKKYKDLFREVLAKLASEKYSLRISEEDVYNDHVGRNESDVAILFFDEEVNRPSVVLEEFPQIHKLFVEAIRNSDLIPTFADPSTK